jgi:hypothetical protein
MKEQERITELVIKAGDITDRSGWRLSTNENLVSCSGCLSHLVYVKINWGVVAEDYEWMVQYNRGKTVYALREVGLVLYCAKCGEFIEDYCKYFYPEDKMVFYDFTFDELDADERREVEVCLHQFNQTGKFTSRYKSDLFFNLKKSLDEYEKKHPLINQNKRKKITKKIKEHTS